jgi:glutaminase
MQTFVIDYLNQVLDAARGEDSGAVASYIPQLATADPTPLGVALCMPDGTLYGAGDDDVRFTIQSISKPFVYALALEEHGMETVAQHVGMEPSGDAFNEISLEEVSGRPDNPMINIGAITTHTLVGPPGCDEEDRTWRVIQGLSAFAGRDLELDTEVFASELSEAWRNLALASLVRANGIISEDPDVTVRGYTRQCSVLVDARDLAVMGMTLASGGINPLTRARVVSEEVTQQVLSVMTTCGMYDTAGDWLSAVGIPAKSGVAGGLLGALPGQVGVGTFSPRLDPFGHSTRGVRIFEDLSSDLNLHLMRTPPPKLDVIGRRSTSRLGRRRVVLQGSLDFTSAELALRHFAEIEPGRQDVVVDLRRVPSISAAGQRMLTEGMRRLAEDGHQVLCVDPHGRIGDGSGGLAAYVRRVDADPDDD